MNQKPFSFDTIKDFDGHIAASIIGYENLQNLIIPLASNYIVPGCTVLDIGCSSARMIFELNLRYSDAYYLGYDTAIQNLVDPRMYEYPNVKLYEKDVTTLSPIPDYKFGLMLFTFQFLPPEKRDDFLKRLLSSLLPGGALIVAEKVYCSSAKIQDHFQFAHYDLKRLNFTSDQILQKQRDIRPLMKPLSESELTSRFDLLFEDMRYELFWASYNFRAWVITK